MFYQWREFKKLWKELIDGGKPKINKKQIFKPKKPGWMECLDGDEFIASVATHFDVLWPWLSVVNVNEYSTKNFGTRNVRHELTPFEETWSFPLNFVDNSTGRWMAIVWGCHLGRRPTFEEYFSSVKADRTSRPGSAGE